MNKNEIVYGPPLMPEPSSYEKGEEVRIFNDPNEFENYIKLNTEHQIIDFNVPASYDSVHINTLYSSLQNMFDDLPLLSHAIPMCAAAQKNYKIINGWSINEVQIKFLSGGSLEIEREGQKNRKFINLFSAGQTIKDVHCAWEITKNDKIVSCGSFYIPGHFDQLIEITDIEEDCCMTIICSDDTRWKSDFTFNISGNGRHVIPLFPNDIIMKKILGRC